MPAIGNPISPCEQCRLFCAIADTDVGNTNVLSDIEGGEEGEEITIEADADTEVEPVNTATDLGKLTDKQIEEHRATHLPYRSWCRWCVLGRGRGLQHRVRPGPLIPITGTDYYSLTGSGIKLRSELEMRNVDVDAARQRGELATCFVVRCYVSKALF